MPELFTNSAIAIVVLMLTTWLISLPIRNASVIDLVWGVGFVVVAWVGYFTVVPASDRKLLLAGLITIWGLRLSCYLAWRNVGKGEDFRYVNMRNKHGSKFWIVSLLTVFTLQGVIMWLVSLPIQLGEFNADLRPLNWLDALGVAIWCLGFFFESVGDFQLARFKANADNAGKVMNRGLWRYTRHPNYFGDFMVWWGLYIVSVSSRAGYWSIVGPLLMSFFIMKVSGVTMLERSLTNTKAGFAEYQQRTNAFFPWLPKEK